MKRLLIISAMLILSCATREKQIITEPVFDLSTLEGFFKTAEADVFRAKQVVEKNKIIFNLTHLKLMNTGGRKYYLLERETITEMINAVTEGIYLDYILINKSGDIIYTRINENIFGCNINNGFEDTPLRKCYLSRTAVHFEDVSAMTTGSPILGMYVSVPVLSDGIFQGTLILQIDIEKINQLFNDRTDIISREGLIRITSDRTRILSQYRGFAGIDIPSLDRNSNWSDMSGGSRIDYSVFNYREISWIIARR